MHRCVVQLEFGLLSTTTLEPDHTVAAPRTLHLYILGHKPHASAAGLSSGQLTQTHVRTASCTVQNSTGLTGDAWQRRRASTPCRPPDEIPRLWAAVRCMLKARMETMFALAMTSNLIVMHPNPAVMWRSFEACRLPDAVWFNTHMCAGWKCAGHCACLAHFD